MKKIGDVTSTADKNGEWTNGNVAAGIAPTILEAGWLNSVQREILGVLIEAGISQDKNNDNQLKEAIKKIISSWNYATLEDLKKYLAKDQNGADIPNKETFIKNLGLPEKYQPKGDYQPAGDYALQSEVNKKRSLDNNSFPDISYQNKDYPNDRIWFYRSVSGGSGVARTKDGVVGYNNFREGKTGDVAHTDELFGAGQRWVNVTASRQQGVVYTNTTPKTIFIAISHIHSNKANGEYVGFGFGVDGEVLYSATATNNMWMEALSVPVQPGGEYVFNADPTQINYKKWMEFRP
ncbi:hypothetical protein AB7038_01395 [Morganella morganii]|uniref:hypothetical protein n=1 Tax=Morganella morganii TaxID=582 RepID=UPI0034E49E7F